MPTRTNAGRRRGTTIALFVLLAAILAGTYPFLGSEPWRETIYFTLAGGGAVLAFVGSRALPARSRRTWGLVVAGIASSCVGDGIWTYLLLRTGEEPDASLADPFWLASYVLIAVAIFRMGAGDDERLLDVDAAIDSATVGILVTLVVWQAAVSEIVLDASSPLALRALWSAYPILDAVLLTLVVRLVLRRSRQLLGLLLATGIACWLVADLGYLAVTTDLGMRWLDTGWMMAAVLLGVAAFADRAIPAPAEPSGPRRLSTARLALGVTPLLAPALLEIEGWATGTDPNPIPLLVAAIALTSLIFVRTWRSVRNDERLRHELHARERRYRALASHASDAAIVVGVDLTPLSDVTGIVRFLTDLGVDPAMVAGVGPDDEQRFRRLLERARLTDGQVVEDEWSVVRLDGTTAWVELRAVSLLDDPDVAGIVLNLNDITARKQAEEELTHQALHDGLTGLANRLLFRERISHALRGRRRRDRSVAVIYLDLDGFKTINDSLGHDAGDTLLREVAARLQTIVRDQDTVARLGGDEFAILLEDPHDPLDEAETVCTRVLQVLSTPIDVHGRPVTVSASLGVAIGDGAESPTSLLRNADIAMYTAKANGRGGHAVYEAGMQTAADQRLQLELDLASAIDGDQLRLDYQPVIALDSGQVVGFEALVRWEHPTLGELPPDEFIPIAEETGLILPLGRWVLDHACATLAEWQELAHDGSSLTMAVNVSARQLADPEFVGQVRDAIAAHDLVPSTVVLEITESVLVHDVATTSMRLRELHDLGTRLAVDDFGTGYSSLGYLRQFPVDILKIDRSFTSTMEGATEVPALVRGLLDLAKTLTLETIAEGVEVEDQRRQLVASGCALGQGYLFARPLARDVAQDLVRGADPRVTLGAEASAG